MPSARQAILRASGVRRTPPKRCGYSAEYKPRREKDKNKDNDALSKCSRVSHCAFCYVVRAYEECLFVFQGPDHEAHPPARICSRCVDFAGRPKLCEGVCFLEFAIGAGEGH